MASKPPRIMSEDTTLSLWSRPRRVQDLRITMNALQRAPSRCWKARGHDIREYEALAERLCTQLAIMSQVKVVRRRQRDEVGSQGRAVAASAIGGYQMLGIVSSTGGPNALATARWAGARFPLRPAGTAHHQQLSRGIRLLARRPARFRSRCEGSRHPVAGESVRSGAGPSPAYGKRVSAG